jgi:hypothetical protein
MFTFYIEDISYRGNHVSNPEERIILQEDNNNPHDMNAVKILVGTGDTNPTHVAYASRNDCPRLRAAMSDGRISARLIERYHMSAKLELL